MARLLRGMMLFLGLVFPSFLATAEMREPHALEQWPADVISFANVLRNSYGYFDDKYNFSDTIIERERLSEKSFPQLFKVFKPHPPKTNPVNAFYWIGHYCWLKLQPGFSCGDPAFREFSDTGYLYVSDPLNLPTSVTGVEPEGEPFLILILVGVSPRRTAIYRLFEDRLELVYDLYDKNDEYGCGLDRYSALFVTYGVDVRADGTLLLTETEGFHWDMLPRRKYVLTLTDKSCHMEKIDEYIPELLKEQAAKKGQ